MMLTHTHTHFAIEANRDSVGCALHPIIILGTCERRLFHVIQLNNDSHVVFFFVRRFKRNVKFSVCIKSSAYCMCAAALESVCRYESENESWCWKAGINFAMVNSCNYIYCVFFFRRWIYMCVYLWWTCQIYVLHVPLPFTFAIRGKKFALRNWTLFIMHVQFSN